MNNSISNRFLPYITQYVIICLSFSNSSRSTHTHTRQLLNSLIYSTSSLIVDDQGMINIGQNLRSSYRNTFLNSTESRFMWHVVNMISGRQGRIILGTLGGWVNVPRGLYSQQEHTFLDFVKWDLHDMFHSFRGSLPRDRENPQKQVACWNSCCHESRE